MRLVPQPARYKSVSASLRQLHDHCPACCLCLAFSCAHIYLQKLFLEFLPGKVAVITGGGRGIGQAIAEKYATQGFTLILTARSKDQLEEVYMLSATADNISTRHLLLALPIACCLASVTLLSALICSTVEHSKHNIISS